MDRFTLLRAPGARHRAEEARKTGSAAAAGHGEPLEQAARLAASLGLECQHRPQGQHRGEWRCKGDKLPGYTGRNRALEQAMLTPAPTRSSAALHAEWHAVTSTWKEVTLPEGTRALVVRPDRVAVWGAVLICAAPAVVPAVRALQLLDHRARSRELGLWVNSTFELMRRMDLPREWWRD